MPDTNILEVSVKRYFSTQEQQESVLQKYRDLLTKNNNYGLLAVDMWEVCMAGGLDISQPMDKQNCTQFVNSLVAFGDDLFAPVCEDISKVPADMRDKSKCEEKFFNNTNVQLSSAIALAKLYASKKYKDDIICSTKYRRAGNDDFVQCKSIKTGAFYEFKFDDVRESFDDDIRNDILDAVCRVYDKTASFTFDMKTKPGCLETDENTCNEIQASFNTIVEGTRVTYKADINKCEVGYREFVWSEKDLKRACDIDPFTFCRGTQFNTNLEFLEALKEYTAKQCQTEMFNIRCDSSFKTYTGPGCRVSNTAPKDDIVSCYFGDQQIDYVFDDVNEFSKKRADAGMQAMSCILLDGTFDGKNCVGLGKEECELLANQGKVDCPDCKGIRWDEDKGLCILPDAKNLTNGEKVLKIAGVTGAVIVAVVATVATGGAAAGGWAVVAKVGTGMVVAGGALKTTSEAVMTFGVFEHFVKKANKCLLEKTSECAEELLIGELNKMENYGKDLQEAEQKALNPIFEQLVNQLDNDSKFWTDFYSNPDFFECDINGDNCRVKDSAQFWQVASTAGDISMAAGALLNIVANVGSYFTATKNAIHVRVNEQASLLEKAGTNKEIRIKNDDLAKLGFSNNSLYKGTKGTVSQTIKTYGLEAGKEYVLGQGARVTTKAALATNLMAADIGLITAGGGAAGLVEGALNEDSKIEIAKPEKPQPEQQNIDQQDSANDDNGDNGNDTSASDGHTITPYDVKKPKTGLIATAAVLGTVGTGFLVGKLLNRNQDDPSASQDVITGSTVDNEIRTILNNANGFIGTVNNNRIILEAIPTSLETVSPIVNINNNAVV
ncbi:MAG: hypothetical protein ACLRFN_04375, partial [Alphaproteobacteria bacterium]